MRLHVWVPSIPDSNVELVRRAFQSNEPTLLAEGVAWHFLPAASEPAVHFEGREQVSVEWPTMLEQLTSGTFHKQLVDVWPVGEDLVVAHVEVEMTMNGVRRAGSTVVVYRVADGVVVEGFDIPSASV